MSKISDAIAKGREEFDNTFDAKKTNGYFENGEYVRPSYSRHGKIASFIFEKYTKSLLEAVKEEMKEEHEDMEYTSADSIVESFSTTLTNEIEKI